MSNKGFDFEDDFNKDFGKSNSNIDEGFGDFDVVDWDDLDDDGGSPLISLEDDDNKLNDKGGNREELDPRNSKVSNINEGFNDKSNKGTSGVVGLSQSFKNIFSSFLENPFIKKIMPLFVGILVIGAILLLFLGEGDDTGDKEIKKEDTSKGIIGMLSRDKSKGTVDKEDKSTQFDKSKNNEDTGSETIDGNKKDDYKTLSYIKKPLETDLMVYKVFDAGFVPLNNEIYDNIYNIDKEINVILKINLAMKGKDKVYYNLNDFKLKTLYSYHETDLRNEDRENIKKDIRATESDLYSYEGVEPIMIGSKIKHTLGDSEISDGEIENGYLLFKVDRDYLGDYILEFNNNGKEYNVIIKHNEIL